MVRKNNSQRLAKHRSAVANSEMMRRPPLSVNSILAAGGANQLVSNSIERPLSSLSTKGASVFCLLCVRWVAYNVLKTQVFAVVSVAEFDCNEAPNPQLPTWVKSYREYLSTNTSIVSDSSPQDVVQYHLMRIGVEFDCIWLNDSSFDRISLIRTSNG